MKELHACGVIIKNGKILLTQRPLTDYSEPGKWNPINETVEEGESPDIAVVRGAKEEVGLKFTITKVFKPITFVDPDTYIFIGIGKGKIVPQESEVAQFGWFSFTEAQKLEYAYNYDKLIEDLHMSDLL
ncbi:NUDIX hydrolase [Candidatus Dojkabacteria bacterium]|nr:NUDIX hydrolase [Candidatus Dojkabacteria bacterium]